MNATHASIRADLYEKGLRILGVLKIDGEVIVKQWDPLYWDIVSDFGDAYLLRNPFGANWLFDSIDLDFYTLSDTPPYFREI